MEELTKTMHDLSLYKNFSGEEYLKSLKLKIASEYLSEKMRCPRESKKSICGRIGVPQTLLNTYLRDLGYGKLIRSKKPSKKIKTYIHPVKNMKGGAEISNSDNDEFVKSVLNKNSR